MARILYITGVAQGFEDALYEGRPSRGMPAFVGPLRALVERGESVDLLVATPRTDPPAPRTGWLSDCRIEAVHWNIETWPQKVRSVAELFRATRRVVSAHRYDLAYLHGSVAAAGHLALFGTGVPVAMRLYGTFLADEADAVARSSGAVRMLRRFRLATAHPLEYLSFRLPKEFLLVTDDGTGADRVHAVVRGRYRWLFWRNGVDVPVPAAPAPDFEPPFDEPFLLYPARVSAWKRQERAIALLSELARTEGLRPRLIVAGHVTEESYRQRLTELAATAGLSDRVVITGSLPRPDLWELYRHPNCLAVLSFYDMSQLGNSTLEALAHGAVLIARNDGSLAGIVEHGTSAILVDEPEAAAAWVAKVHHDPELRQNLQRGARRAVADAFLTVEERIEREVALVEATIGPLNERHC